MHLDTSLTPHISLPSYAPQKAAPLRVDDALFHLYRLQAIATPLVPNMEKVQIIPPPKDVDPRMLAWKGAAVFGKMDALADLWVTAADWVSPIFPACSA